MLFFNYGGTENGTPLLSSKRIPGRVRMQPVFNGLNVNFSDRNRTDRKMAWSNYSAEAEFMMDVPHAGRG